MRILIVAPKICTPWSEGRKKFVQDLVASLGLDNSVTTVTTIQEGQSTSLSCPTVSTYCKSKIMHLLQLHRLAKKQISLAQYDLICHLPFGSFNWPHSLANIWSMSHIDKLCKKSNTPCFTLMYAISNEAKIKSLKRHVSHLVTNQFYRSGDLKIRFGITLDHENSTSYCPDQSPGKRLLFMAGMWEKTQERLQHILELRGLKTLLQAGEYLSSKDYTLTIASPLFHDNSFQEKILTSKYNTWPCDKIVFKGEVKKPEIFNSHDFFIFPYGREEEQFIPTSVIEAMLYGVPVILPDLVFLENIANNEKTAGVYAAGNSYALACKIISLHNNKTIYNSIRNSACIYIKENMDINNSKKDLLSLYHTIKNHA